ncbi:MAG: Ig-like domain-containing protein [Clostridia bacterium]|nr:Ig-like domain-containing protein [Clostridia bacterium]
MKKKLLSIFCTVFVAGMLFVGCDSCDSCKGEPPSTEPQIEQTSSVGLNIEKRDMTLGDIVYLVARADGATENADFKWESSNEQVATVDQQGTVIAMGSGEAVISATYGTDKAECHVVVAANGNIPTLQFNADFKSNSIKVSLDNQINLGCKVLFNQKTFDDVEVAYTPLDPTVGTVEDGVFKPLKVGSTQVTITASWRGLTSEQYETMSQVITVNVEELKAIILDNGALGDDVLLDLFSQKEFGGKTFKNEHTVAVKALEGESEKTCTGTIIEGEDVIEYDDATRTITGKSFGEAKIKFAFTDSDNAEYSVVLPVRVFRPIADYATTLRFSTFDATFSNAQQEAVTVDDIFGYATTLVAVEQDGNDAIALEDGKVTGLALEAMDRICDATITVYDEKVGYVLSLEACAKYIYTAEDLRIFDQGTNKDNLKELEGYFELFNDIVDTEYTYNKYSLERMFGGYATAWYDDYGFKGIFEGNGHSLTFTTCAGLFNSIQEESEIRNVEFKNITVESILHNSYLTPIGMGHGSLLKNVSLSLSPATYNNFVSLDDTSTNGRSLYVFPRGNPYGNSMSYENVVFVYDYKYIPEDVDNSSVKKTVLFNNAQYYKKNFTNPFVNIYIVERNKDADKDYVLPLTVGGRKQDAEYQYQSYHTLEEFAELVEVFIYEEDEIKEFFASGDGKAAFSTFASYWSIEERGYPIWASSYNEVEWAESLGTGMFSGWLDETEGFATDKDGDNQVLPFDIDGTVTGVYLKENISSDADLTPENNLYANGKVNITSTSTRAIEYTTILIQTAEGDFYEATLEVYTRIINSKEDLRMFDLDSATDGRALTGYYALGSDIVDTEEVYNSVNCGTSYFQGVFDGKGHSVTFTTVGGLFGKIKGSGSMAIKNVNFKDCTVTTSKEYGYARTLIGYLSSSSYLYLQNLSISLSEQTYQNFKDDSAPNLYVVAYDMINEGANFVVCTNVMVEVDYNKMPTADATSETKFIYIVSQLRKNTSNFNVVALNYDSTKTYARSLVLIEDEKIITGSHPSSFDVTEYASYDKLKEYYATEAGQAALAKFDTTYWDVSLGYPVWKKD